MQPIEASSYASPVERQIPVKDSTVTRKRTQSYRARASSGASTPRSGRAISDPAASERAGRVRRLYTLTQADYDHLLTIVKAIVPPQLCDPHDALGHGLLIALQKYTGDGPLTAYVPRCAWLYALQQAKKRRRQVDFCDLQTNEEFADYLDHVLPFLEDPRYAEAVDEVFIRRVEEILEGMYDWRSRYSTHEAIANATRVLALFRDNANLGKGIGIDEYENTPPTNRPGRPAHNTKVVRKLIVDHLCDEFQADRKDMQSALQALRLSTRQALQEGWLAA